MSVALFGATGFSKQGLSNGSCVISWMPNSECFCCCYKSITNKFSPLQKPSTQLKMNIANYCNSMVLVNPFFSHNSPSWTLKCICQFGSSFIIWNVPQCLFKNSYSLIVPSLSNGKSEKNYLCCMQQYLTYLILDSGIYCRPGSLYLSEPPRKGNGRLKHSWPKNQ